MKATGLRSARAARPPEAARGIDLTVIPSPGARELHATLRTLPGESPTGLARRLDAALREHDAAVVRLDAFGPLDACAAVRAALKALPGGGDWPVTWIGPAGTAEGPPAGMHVLAVSGPAVETIEADGRPAGRVYEDGVARHLHLGDLRPADAGATRADQALRVFETLESAVRAAGLHPEDIVRTWFYLDDILSWYDDFNRVRTGWLRRHDITGRLPASTGVGGRSVDGAAVTAAAWAARPRSPQAFLPRSGGLRIREVRSPLQGPAPHYGSRFSRAVELDAAGRIRLLVSGTASITADGLTAFTGDVEGQIGRTMDVVRALLASRGLEFGDVTRATAYFRDPADAAVFARKRRDAGVPDFPLLEADAVLCRDDLLFEIEIDASREGPR